MTNADYSAPIGAAPGRVQGAVGGLRLPLNSWRFWVVQAGVLLVAFLDEIVLDFLRFLPPFDIPRSTVTALLLIPVIYAALNFGVHGAVGTALWATALMCPDWLFIGGLTPANAWVEIGNLAILNGGAIIVGQRVENEGLARLRAERALRASPSFSTRCPTMIATPLRMARFPISTQAFAGVNPPIKSQSGHMSAVAHSAVPTAPWTPKFSAA